MAVRHLVADPLHVEPGLIGRPLASPVRRLLAFAIDAAVLLVPTLVVGLGAAALSLYFTDRPSFDAVRHVGRMDDKNPAVAAAEARGMARLLVRIEAAGVPPAMALAVEEGDLDRAAALLRDRDIVFALGLGEGGEPTLAPKQIRFPVDRLIPGPVRAITLLAVPALYFAGFGRSRRRATPGKRVVGIHIARLDGERLGWLEGIERFIGYVHIPATAFVSLADLWRDPNRRLPHDRTVHTAVLRGRPPAGSPGDAAGRSARA
jgi:uncharacterized RDD family membrane protein YckC